MLKVLYIGHYTPGSTSRMRASCLQRLLPDADFIIASIDSAIEKTNRVFRSIGWRFKVGPLISRINESIRTQLDYNYSYDIVWIDKGVFIEPELVMQLKANSKKLIHFTPDPAFLYHQSKLFYKALPFYDYCITTKSFELTDYQKHFHGKTILCTQGYDPDVHFPCHSFKEKSGVSFIGHHENERELIISQLVESDIEVTLAGNNWDRFARRYKSRKNLNYLGDGVFGDAYRHKISASLISLGLISKWIPELHTTRTFEIPACGTALVTERNQEISAFFEEDEVVLYDDPSDICGKISEVLKDENKLKSIINNGHNKVTTGGFDYENILKKLLVQTGIL